MISQLKIFSNLINNKKLNIKEINKSKIIGLEKWLNIVVNLNPSIRLREKKLWKLYERNVEKNAKQTIWKLNSENINWEDKVSAATQIATKKLLKTKNLICFFKLIIRKQY